MKKHPDHSAELNRINRMIGQLEGVKKMIGDNVYCSEILIQTKAISSALRSLETTILERHIHHCVHGSLKSEKTVDKTVEELVHIFKTRLK
jgi:DNA-binding FrmR family transcriptional regulator